MAIKAGVEKRAAASGTYELLNIATKVGRLADQVSRESKASRITGRLIRDEHDVEALAESHILLARAGDDLLADDSLGFVRLQLAMAQVSYRLWEDLWNEKYPDRFGQAWEGEDIELMSVWRKDVRVMVKECRQGGIFTMPAKEYVAKLIDCGASKETAEEQADWMSKVRYEGTTGSC